MSKKVHELKCLSHHFQAVVRGNKRAELRFNDREFKAGDLVRLWEIERSIYAGENKITHTGNNAELLITHVLGPAKLNQEEQEYLGLKPGWVIFSFYLL